MVNEGSIPPTPTNKSIINLILVNMKNYIIAKKGLTMDNHWTYALSVEGRKAFDKADKATKSQILTILLMNGNITGSKMIQLYQFFKLV